MNTRLTLNLGKGDVEYLRLLDIARYLPRLERCANFLETRRDPKNNLYRVGPAGNLLAPSYAGWKRPDGSYGQAYLAGLSITTVAALDRLIELEKLASDPKHVPSEAEGKADLYSRRRDLTRKGLARLTTEEGYFVKSLDPDGTRHGVYGAARHGYFEASPNHDAIAFHVVDDAQSERIYAKIAAIPGLRPHDFILPNTPSLDDMYEKPEGLWEFGRWVNGGHWSTCEARMVLAYCRLGKYEDARRSMRRLLTFARRFRMDNPLTQFGSDVYQPKEPINLCYDTFGPAAALVRGLFEYLYRADGLTLLPRVPPGITELEQRFPIRFGKKRIYLATFGSGAVTAVRVNGRPWKSFDARSIFLPYDKTPERARIEIALGGARLRKAATDEKPITAPATIAPEELLAAPEALAERGARLRELHVRLIEAGRGDSYEAAHARLALEAIATIGRRRKLQAEGKIPPLPEASQAAADRSYEETATLLCEGLEKVLDLANAEGR